LPADKHRRFNDAFAVFYDAAAAAVNNPAANSNVINSFFIVRRFFI